jgi:hypothetical protein
MATNPDWHPLDREIEEILEANPGLEEELNRMAHLQEEGRLPVVEHREAIARLRRLGLPVEGDPSSNSDPQS